MVEIEIETSCFECETNFDDDRDTKDCSVCENPVCDDCQEKHAQQHCFETKDAIKKPEEKKKQRKKK